MGKHRQIIDWLQIPKDWPHLYRAEAHPCGDEYWDGYSVEICIRQLTVVKYTAAGVWISDYGCERFINLRASKQYASVTEREAKLNLYFRKLRQLQIVQYQKQVAEIAVDQLKKELFQ